MTFLIRSSCVGKKNGMYSDNEVCEMMITMMEEGPVDQDDVSHISRSFPHVGLHLRNRTQGYNSIKKRDQ